MKKLTTLCESTGIKGAEMVFNNQPQRFVAGYNIDYVIWISKTKKDIAVRFTDTMDSITEFHLPDTDRYMELDIYLQSQKTKSISHMVNNIKQLIE